jgi:hypothetical protein
MSAKLRTRRQRSLGPRPRTVRARELQREVVREAEPLFDRMVPLPPRPQTRGDCLQGPRPCPYVGCRHHTFLTVKENGLIQYTFPGKEFDELDETCSLDVADQVERGDRPKLSLEQVGDLTNLTRERIHLIVLQGLEQIRQRRPDLVEQEDSNG